MGEDNANDNEWGIDRRTVLKSTATASAIGLIGVTSLSGTAAATTTTDLVAGQNTPVGHVSVEEDGGNLEITYSLVDGWRMTESHLHVADKADHFPANRAGNPKVGKFNYSDDHGVIEDSYTYVVSIDEKWSNPVYIAAHAVVEEYEENFADKVSASDQGNKKNGNNIAESRSDPNAALVQDYPDGEFFSLGFKKDEGDFLDEGGYIEVEFDCPVVNGEGDNLRIWEVTFGTAPDDYPLETADVYADDDGDWVLLGEADNTDQGPQGTSDALTVSDFDLDTVGLDETEKVRIVDTTDPSPHNGNADAFDVDGIQALQGCVIREETAWGDGEDFDGNNWATYFEHKLDE